MGLRVLIVRTSSLGDLVHMLPAISDIAHHRPDAQLDWVVEESFKEIPSWHKAIGSVVAVAQRRWRKQWWSPAVRLERRAFFKQLAARSYDIVLDMQGLLKSAWITRHACGIRHGLDQYSAREPLASLFYNVKHSVDFWQPAVTRQRQLAAMTFGYTYTAAPDFGLQHFIRTAVQTDALPYAVIMPSASRSNKLWSAANWRIVLTQLHQAGCALRLLAGNPQETERARELISGIENATVLPYMDLTRIAHLLAGARLMVGLDSGLTHLSAALGRPTVGIYCASTPIRTPLTGLAFNASLGERGMPPLCEQVLAAVEQAWAYAA